MITTCRCGAFKLLTATGVRYEEDARAICRHGIEACRWFAELPSEVALGSRAPATPSEAARCDYNAWCALPRGHRDGCLSEDESYRLVNGSGRATPRGDR